MNNTVRIENDDYLDLIGDGAMANTKTADGKLIPILILDTTIKKDFEHLVNLHNKSHTGDVTSLWAYKRFNNKSVSLVLNFESPVELKIAISFNVQKHLHLIEGIRVSRAVYLQPGTPGDRVKHDVNAPKILVEIPARTTFDKWESILRKEVSKKLKKEGIGRKALNEAVNDYIKIRRDVWGKRFK